MGERSAEKAQIVLYDDLADVIAQHRYGDLIGDYEIAPYRKFITCGGCDWKHDIAGMSGWRSWIAKHAEHVAETIRNLIPEPDNHHNAALCAYCTPSVNHTPGGPRG